MADSLSNSRSFRLKFAFDFQPVRGSGRTFQQAVSARPWAIVASPFHAIIRHTQAAVASLPTYLDRDNRIPSVRSQSICHYRNLFSKYPSSLATDLRWDRPRRCRIDGLACRALDRRLEFAIDWIIRELDVAQIPDASRNGDSHGFPGGVVSRVDACSSRSSCASHSFDLNLIGITISVSSIIVRLTGTRSATCKSVRLFSIRALFVHRMLSEDPIQSVRFRLQSVHSE